MIPIAAVMSLGGKILERVIPDPAARQAAQAELATLAATQHMAELQAAAGVVAAEATGESWLQRNWRPVTMLTFVALVVAHWLGWTAPGISEAQIQSLLEIVKIGLGGYVVGRSAEKVVKTWKAGRPTD